MNMVNACLHLANFFAPAMGVGLLTATLVKWVWRSALHVTWARLALTSCFACAIALVLGLLAFGSDGKMATYGLMLLVCTASIAWFGFCRGSR